MKIIDIDLFDLVSRQAKVSPRLRMNYNFHDSLDDPINRLLNAMEPGTYIHPHRHINPDKTEIFLVLRGKILMLLFDDRGTVTSAQIISPDSGVYGMEIEAGIWHSLIVLETDTILYEIKNGPFVPLSDENLATWAPSADNVEATAKYMADLSAEYLPI